MSSVQNAAAVATAMRTALAGLADAQRAPAMRAYMRDQFVFFGIATPIRRAAMKPLQPDGDAGFLLAIAEALWQMPERECRYAAVDLLARRVRRLGLAALPQLLDLARRDPWWDTVDGLASVVGKIVRAARHSDPQAQRAMDAALTDPSLWVRRIAMIHQLGWRADTDCQRLFAYARQLAPEPDFFIRKAIGWALRDYARHDPEAIRQFVADCPELSPLSRREAMKHLG